jgi:hypothetical protein
MKAMHKPTVLTHHVASDHTTHLEDPCYEPQDEDLMSCRGFHSPSVENDRVYCS